nr:hypothetical protein [Pseudomonadota bacterium]
MSARKAFPVVVVLVVAAPPAAAFSLADKTVGWVIGKVDAALPGELTYESFDGRLRGPYIFHNLRYKDAGVDVQIDRFEFDWRIRSVFTGTARLESFAAQGVEVHLYPTPPKAEEEPKEPFVLSDITLPIDVDVKNATVTDLRIWPVGAAEPVVINAIELAARTQDDALVLQTLALRMPGGQLDATGRITPTGAFPLQLDLDWNYALPQVGKVAGKGGLSGELRNELTLSHDISGAVEADLRAQLRDVFQTPAWQARIDLETFPMGALAPEMQGANLTGQAQTAGTVSDYQASGQLTTTLPEIGETSARLDLSGGSEAIRIQELILKAADSPMSLTARADVSLKDQTIDASGQWQALAWPPVGEAQVESPRGQFTAQGTFQDYRARLEAALAGLQFGRLDAVIAAQGTDKAVQLSQIRLTDPDGQLALNATGEFTFAGQRFQAGGEWREFAWPLVGEPQIKSPQGKFTAQGTPRDYQAAVDAALASSQFGRIDAAVKAQGSDQQIRVTEITLKDPDGRLALDAQGEFAFAQQRFDASGTWTSLVWPLVGEPQITSPQGEFTAQGTPRDFAAQLQAALGGPALGRLDARVEAKGTD